MKTKSNATVQLEARIRELEGSVRRLKKLLAQTVSDLEKRTLLRLPGERYCRICSSGGTGRPPIDPPVSDLEKAFCRASHRLAPVKPSRSGKAAKSGKTGTSGESRAGKRKQRFPLDWEEGLRLTR
jgi:hypothetical protein